MEKLKSLSITLKKIKKEKVGLERKNNDLEKELKKIKGSLGMAKMALKTKAEEELDENKMLNDLNSNLPADIKVLELINVDENFNIINDAKEKEYLYLFTHAEKPHPFCASLMTFFREDLDIELMKKVGFSATPKYS